MASNILLLFFIIYNLFIIIASSQANPVFATALADLTAPLPAFDLLNAWGFVTDIVERIGSWFTMIVALFLPTELCAFGQCTGTGFLVIINIFVNIIGIIYFKDEILGLLRTAAQAVPL